MDEMSASLRKSGLDPSILEERAHALAKLAGEKRKRRDEDEDAEMDVDGEEGEEGAEWMDVDGEEEATPNKRIRTESGAVTAAGRRAPKSNRQFAGMRDTEVSFGSPERVPYEFLTGVCLCSKQRRPRSSATSTREGAICMRRLARPIVIFVPRWCVSFFLIMLTMR